MGAQYIKMCLVIRNIVFSIIVKKILYDMISINFYTYMYKNKTNIYLICIDKTQYIYKSLMKE